MFETISNPKESVFARFMRAIKHILGLSVILMAVGSVACASAPKRGISAIKEIALAPLVEQDPARLAVEAGLKDKAIVTIGNIGVASANNENNCGGCYQPTCCLGGGVIHTGGIMQIGDGGNGQVRPGYANQGTNTQFDSSVRVASMPSGTGGATSTTGTVAVQPGTTPTARPATNTVYCTGPACR